MPRMKSDPLLAALIAKLPAPGTEWPVENQTAWLNLMAMALGAVYGGDAASKLGTSFKPTQTNVKPFKPIEHEFYIDKNGFARRAGGHRIMPKEVGGALIDLRGMDGDVVQIIWADESTGLANTQPDLIISAA